MTDDKDELGQERAKLEELRDTLKEAGEGKGQFAQHETGWCRDMADALERHIERLGMPPPLFKYTPGSLSDLEGVSVTVGKAFQVPESGVVRVVTDSRGGLQLETEIKNLKPDQE